MVPAMVSTFQPKTAVLAMSSRTQLYFPTCLFAIIFHSAFAPDIFLERLFMIVLRAGWIDYILRIWPGLKPETFPAARSSGSLLPGPLQLNHGSLCSMNPLLHLIQRARTQ